MQNFKIGDQVKHAYTKEPLWVLRTGKEQILCRTTDLREIWFYPQELEGLNESREYKNTGSRFL